MYRGATMLLRVFANGIKREARDRQLRFQLDSGREHPRDMSSSETGHCKSGIDESSTVAFWKVAPVPLGAPEEEQ
eukprot:gene23868-biopygen9686